MTLGQKIKEARRRAGLSQEQLAEKLIISRSAIAKWEADVGTPDIENLKALSAALEISIDHLLDDTPDLQQTKRSETISPETYCGRSCQGCTIRTSLHCNGCKQYLHGEAGGCAIARCCCEKHLAACLDCGYRDACNKLRSVSNVPHQRLQTYRLHEKQWQAQEALQHAKQQWHTVHAPRFSRGLRRMLAFSLLADVLSIMFLLTVELRSFDFLPMVRLPLAFLVPLAMLLRAGCTLQLAPASPSYRTAAWFTIGAVPFALLTNLQLEQKPASLLFMLPLIPTLILMLISQYHLCRSHAAITEDLDSILSRRWRSLWKWQTGTLIICFCFPFCGLLLLAIPLLGYWVYGIIVPLLPCFALAIEFVRLYYLFHTAQLFFKKLPKG